MICPICFKRFRADRGNQRFCSRDCYLKGRSPKLRRTGKQIVREWLAWHRDFNRGNTDSNL